MAVKKARRFGLPLALLVTGIFAVAGMGGFVVVVGSLSAPQNLAAGSDATTDGVSAVDVEPGSWMLPGGGSYRVTSWFGWRPNVYPNNHFAVDMVFEGGCGAPVRAASSGVVEYAAWAEGGWGNRVIIAHPDGTKTAYAHALPNSFMVEPGDVVETGDPISRQGNTGISGGCHVHFETYQDGIRVDPVPFMSDRDVTF